MESKEEVKSGSSRPATLEDIACPICKSTESVYFAEYVFRGIGFKEIRDGTLVFDTGRDEMIWEDSKDPHLCCKACCHEWPLPKNVQIDFE